MTDSASTPVTSPASNAVSVTVNSALAAPTVTATPIVVNQGQTSSLTSSVVTTGTSPYTYQWLEKAPGGSFSPVSGATSNSYSFVTSGSTATGSWSFELQVTDATGAGDFDCCSGNSEFCFAQSICFQLCGNPDSRYIV